MTQDMAFTSILHKNMKRLYVLTEANVAWCTVFKAGSTTIIKSFHEIWNNTEVRYSEKLTFHFFKIGQPSLFFVYFWSFSNKQYDFYNKSM